MIEAFLFWPAVLLGGPIFGLFTVSICLPEFVRGRSWNDARCVRCEYPFDGLGTPARCPECGLTRADLRIARAPANDQRVLNRLYMAAGALAVAPLTIWTRSSGFANASDVLAVVALTFLSWVVSRQYLKARHLHATLSVRGLPMLGLACSGAWAVVRVGDGEYDGGAVLFYAMVQAGVTAPLMYLFVFLRRTAGDDGVRRDPPR